MAFQQGGVVSDPERMFEGFENLMPFQVHDILLVSSLYDSFILREDGRLNEFMIGESLELNLAHVPGITHVSSGAEALSALRTHTHINLVVTNAHVGDMDAAQLAAEVRRMGLNTPIVVLAYDQREITRLLARNPKASIEKAFLWQGNARILVAIVNHVEDRRNALHDTRAMGVPVILVVENDVRYYSSFLPEIYTAIITQTRSLISEGFNLAHKLVRMRARPKILLASSYEEAELIVDLYRDYLFGVISDVEFPHRGALNADAGFELAHMVRSAVPDVPIVLHSHRSQFAFRAQREGFVFLEKRSDTLLNDLRKLLTDQFAFGDFCFRLPDGQEVARAGDLNELTQALRTIPAESLVYHSERNHFSHWLMARTEFAVAQRLRPRKVSDFPSSEHLRRDVIASIEDYRQQQNQLLVADFQPGTFRPSADFFLRLGSGSLGGKARGLAFVRYLLHKSGVSKRFPGVRIAVPPTLVIATDLFDLFLQENDLLSFALHCNDDDQVLQRFLHAKLPPMIEESLLAFLAQITYPLAVRSSSLLEDSHYQPFTGVYDTFMLANRHPDLTFRVEQAMEAIKRVYASTFTQHAKSYMRATPYRLEEEKMAVILQQVVGAEHADRYYPHFSGVARSWNFYPVAPMTSGDGVATVALGLGRAVVEGGKALTFCPRAPRQLLQFTSVDDILKNAQSEFWALELNNDHHLTGEIALRESRFDLDIAEQDGTLHLVGSTYSADNNAVYDGLSRKGVRIVSFAPVLKHTLFPLPAIVDCLQKLGEDALGRPVEIEFAVRVSHESTEPSGFGFLQMRPLVLSRESEEVDIDSVPSDQVICRSSRVLGNGRYTDIRDLIVVDYHRFERGRSQQVAQEITRLNSKLLDQGHPYLLIGVGRWGSNDPWLGIPVTWDQIAGAKVIVEAGFRDFRVTPSQGSHFFQNLTAFQVGYFTVNADLGEGFIDWERLNGQPASEERDCVRHLRFSSPLTVLIDGKQSIGVIGLTGR